MIRLEKQCKVCNYIKAEGTGRRSLARRLYESSEYVAGGEALTDIQREHKDHFGYQSLYNHVKKHQALTEKDLKERAIQRVAREADVERIKNSGKYQDLQQSIVKEVLEKLQRGELKLSAKDGLQAAKQLSDKEDKMIDQQQEMMRMVALFASGELSADPLPKPQKVIEGEIVEHDPAADPAAAFFAASDQSRPD